MSIENTKDKVLHSSGVLLPDSESSVGGGFPVSAENCPKLNIYTKLKFGQFLCDRHVEETPKQKPPTGT